ncbi:MAG: hypothetical protein Kow0031_11670 [Anaerolineae bacterium]
MSSSNRVNNSIWQETGPPPKNVRIPHGNISRLVAAAVVDRQLRHLLLTDVPTALARGYNNQPFSLTPDELKLVMSVKLPASLADFARQIIILHNQD